MNIAVFGANGRVGSRTVAIARERLHNVWEIDKNLSENELEQVDAVINFATADATGDVVKFCYEHGCPLISGATGLNREQRLLLDNLAKKLPVVEKSNFSAGVDMLYKLCDLISTELKWDCAITETHRKGKKDAPSGTAKELASKIAANCGSFSSVEIHSLRLGSNFGKHEVVFAANGESITVTHQAENADIFALGAVKEAEKTVRELND